MTLSRRESGRGETPVPGGSASDSAVEGRVSRPRMPVRTLSSLSILAAVAVASSASFAADRPSTGPTGIVVAQNAANAGAPRATSQRPLQAHKASKLRGWQQHAIVEILLASLGIDPEKKLETVRGLQREIAQVIRGTRYGDEALNLRAATDKDVLEALGRIEGEWAKFNNTLAPMLASGEMSAERVGILVERSLPLLAASEQLAERAEIAEGNRRRTYTVLVSTITYATKHAMLSHRVLSEYLLIARGYKVDLTKVKLARSIKEFDDGLKKLIAGSDTDRVLAAPTTEIKDQYQVVSRIWRQMLPVFQSAAGPGAAGSGALQTVAEGMRLSSELERALELYHKL